MADSRRKRALRVESMGDKARKSLKKKLNKVSSSCKLNKVSVINKKKTSDFLPLEGGSELAIEKPVEQVSNVVYIGRIPHGFYEKEMEGFFLQFGGIKRLRIARNKKTGKSKHFGFIEFKYPGVAKVVSETMNNYLLFEHLLQVHLVPPERINPNLWRGFNYRRKPVDRVNIERRRLDKDRTFEEHRKLMDRIVKQDRKRRKKIEAAGIDFECPEIVGDSQPVPKKIRFE